jgi:tetratricopeptide (TPR) repeat protein
MAALRRAALVFFGVALALTGVETAMRAVGWVLDRTAASEAGGDGAVPGAFRVLCLGESTTAPVSWGGGVDYSWPAQLREILRQRYPGRSFQVVNQGRAATSTAAILANAPDYLEQYRPQVVIAMMGINDDKWYGIVAFPSGFGGLLGRGLAHLKVWKLANYIHQEFFLQRRSAPPAGLTAPSPLIAKCLEFRSGAAALRDCTEAMRGAPDDPRPYEALASFYQGQREFGRALSMAEAAERRGSINPRTFLILGDRLSSSKRYEQARVMYRRCIDSAEDDLPMADWCSSRGLAMTYVSENRYGSAAEAYKESIAVYPDWLWKPFAIGSAESSAEKNPVTASNYRLLRRLVQERRSTLIAMQYPGERLRDLKDMLSGASDVVWVDNKESFDRALARRRYDEIFSDRFSGSWGHCTSEGNRIIAENAARALAPLLGGVSAPEKTP